MKKPKIKTIMGKRSFIRFMSQEELEKFLKGETLINTTVHDGRIKGSEGFCFFDSFDIDPITAHHVLSGIATMEYMVEFLVDEKLAERIMKKSKGFYHLPDLPLFEGKELPEYCTKSYNRKDFTIYQCWHLVINYPPFLMGK